jgi:sugar (pentulose or hexulose) kinase
VADLLVGLDMGTSGTKGLLADPDGSIVAQASHQADSASISAHPARGSDIR